MEYGGCLYFELNNKGQDYYYEYSDNRIDVDSGRSALQYILNKFRIKRIWLPIYNCPTVEQRIINVSEIDIEWYNISTQFTPVIDYKKLKMGDAVLWVNYFGVMKNSTIDEVVEIQKATDAIVIIDNIPAYFSKPRMDVINMYSCRKFIGVPDGGHIIGGVIEPEKLKTYSTAENYMYLLSAIEEGSNCAYEGYKKSEQRFNDSREAYGMPALTQKILYNVDYQRIKDVRRKNYLYIDSMLNKANGIKLILEDGTVPLIYPYLTENITLREKLIENHIYVSRFWKCVLSNSLANEFERRLAEYLIPLPLDQRYGEEEIINMVNLVKKLEQETR